MYMLTLGGSALHLVPQQLKLSYQDTALMQGSSLFLLEMETVAEKDMRCCRLKSAHQYLFSSQGKVISEQGSMYALIYT